MKSVGEGLARSDLSKYLLIGGAIFLLYFSLIHLLVDRLAVPYLIGISISYVIAVSIHFFLNRKFTFSDSTGAIRYQALRYIALLFMNYGVTVGVVALCVERLHQPPYLAAFVGIASTTLVGFVASKYWVFAKIGKELNE